MGECCNRKRAYEVVTEQKVSVVDVASVEKMEGEVALLKEGVVGVVPGVFNEGNAYIAKSGGQLAADACALDLLMISVACLKDARVKCLLYDQGNVGHVECTLLGMVDVVSANVRMLNGVACGVYFNGKCSSGVLQVPAFAKADDS